MVTEPIIELAEEICRAVPCAEQVRFTSTGSEATFFALRVARTARQRDKILKFEGGYHGANDYSMMSSSPRSPKAFPAPVPDSSGIPHAIEDRGADRALQRPGHRRGHRGHPRRRAGRGDHRALPAADPAPARVPPGPARDHPAPRHPARLRRGGDRLPPGLRRRAGVLRRGAGHRLRGQDRGRRLPARRGVRLRRADAALRPGQDGKGDFISQSGTLNGNPIAAVAGLATLAELRKPGAYETPARHRPAR